MVFFTSPSASNDPDRPPPPPPLDAAPAPAPAPADAEAEEEEAPAAGGWPPSAPPGPWREKMWTVPLQEEQAMNVEAALKAREKISARSMPRRSSWRSSPLYVSKTRMSVPLSEAVASLVCAAGGG